MTTLDRERIARELSFGLAAARMEPGDRVSLALGGAARTLIVHRLDEHRMEITLVLLRGQPKVFTLDTTAADFPDSLAQILAAA
ncbi:MAG TPA: hypothetical protein VKE22_11050 [Haliangiales bacterium]|nr:hypothetical protein [Haliangiales bacterium]